MSSLSPEHPRSKSRRFTTLLAAFAIAAIVPAGLWTYETVAEWTWFRANPAPGTMVDVGGYRLHLLCTGVGSPAVVLEAGVGDFSLIWNDVQSELSQSVRTCSYDRGGLGWSDPSPLPRDPSHEAIELHRLLERDHVPPPFILVGHSYGGDIVHVYARRFPARLVGVVLVEASNEDKWSRIPGMLRTWQDLNRSCRRDVWRATFGLSGRDPLAPDYPADVRGPAELLMHTKKATRTKCQEYASLIGPGPAEVDSVQSIGSVPLTVISAGQNIFEGATGIPEAEAGAIWTQLQLESLGLSSQSTRVVAGRSGPYVQHDQPEVVIQQVLQLVARVQLDEPCCVDSVQN